MGDQGPRTEGPSGKLAKAPASGSSLASTAIIKALNKQSDFSLLLPPKHRHHHRCVSLLTYRLVPLEVWSDHANEKFGVIFNHYTHASLLAVAA